MSLFKTNYPESMQNLPSCSSVEECQAYLAKYSKEYLEGKLEYREFKKARAKYGASYSETILKSTTIFAYFSSWFTSLKDFIGSKLQSLEQSK